jgi:hypothetical protein
MWNSVGIRCAIFYHHSFEVLLEVWKLEKLFSRISIFFYVVTDVQQEKFFNSINQIVINTPSVFVTDTDKQHTIDNLKTTNSYRKNIHFTPFHWLFSLSMI